MSRADTRFSSEDRRWIAVLVVLLVAAAVAVPFLASRIGDWATSLEDEARRAVAASTADEVSGGDTESVLVLVLDDAAATRSLAVLSRAADQGGVVALIPAPLFDLLPGFGEFALAQATVFDDADLSALVVANTFGVRVDHVVALDPGAFAAVLGSDIEVTLASPVIQTSSDGSAQLIADAGTRTYPAETVEALLVERSDDDVLAWLERQAAVWDAVIAAAGDRTDLVDRLVARAAQPEAAAAVVAAVATASPQVTLFPVERSAGQGDTDGFTVDGVAADAFVADRLGHLRLAEGARSRAEVLNGNGRLQTTRPIVEALVASGFRVVRTDNADRFDFPATLIIAQGDANRDVGERAAAVLGIGALQLELTSPSGVVDVSIIVGLDVPETEG